jgi:hypothetical protein
LWRLAIRTGSIKSWKRSDRGECVFSNLKFL